jgi:hypothetical protein
MEKDESVHDDPWTELHSTDGEHAVSEKSARDGVESAVHTPQ